MSPRDEKIILVVLASCVGVLIIGVVIGLIWHLVFNL
jgi:hypothetical protein